MVRLSDHLCLQGRLPHGAMVSACAAAGDLRTPVTTGVAGMQEFRSLVQIQASVLMPKGAQAGALTLCKADTRRLRVSKHAAQ